MIYEVKFMRDSQRIRCARLWRGLAISFFIAKEHQKRMRPFRRSGVC